MSFLGGGNKNKTKSDTTSSGWQDSQGNTTSTGSQSGMFDTSNELGFADVPETADYRALRDWRPTADPSIGSRFGAMRRRALGGYGQAFAPPELMAARTRALDQEIGQDEGAAYASDAARQNEERFNQLNALYQGQKPISYNKRTSGTTSGTTSGYTDTKSSGRNYQTGTGTQTQPGQSIFGSILGGLAAGAGGAIPW